MIWLTTQIAEIPTWQNKNDFNWQGNLYLGHNARLTYKFKSPIIEYLFDYHQPHIKNKENIATSDNLKLISEMKSYFEVKIKELKRKDQADIERSTALKLQDLRSIVDKDDN